MEAIILSGGFGTRLRPLSFSCPKPLIPFCNTPIMERQIMALTKLGISKVILAVSQNPTWLQEMKSFVKYAEEKYGVAIILSEESSPLGTAGPLALAERHLQGDIVFVLNSDVICDFPLKEMLIFHNGHGGEGTIFTTKTETPSKYGVIISNSKGLVLEFVEKPKEFVGNNINAGIYCFRRSAFKRFQKRKMSIESDVFPKMAEEKQLFSFTFDGEKSFWMDIGQPKDYLTGTQMLIRALGNGAIIGANCDLDSKAEIGPEVVIGSDCVVSAGAVLRNCVLFDGCFIGEKAIVENSIIGWNCVIKNESRISGVSVLERSVVVERKVELEGTLVCSHKTIRNSLKRGSIVL